jgi:hypothetical protein
MKHSCRGFHHQKRGQAWFALVPSDQVPLFGTCVPVWLQLPDTAPCLLIVPV